ncbi:MAG: J domain-containing protein, partial [Pseudomonadota bacterium]
GRLGSSRSLALASVVVEWLSTLMSWIVKGPVFASKSVARGDADDALLGGLATVERVMGQAETAVDRLQHGSALHETLTVEINEIRKRFSVTQALMHDEAADHVVRARRQAAMMRASIKELERIQKIARSAAISRSGVAVSTGLTHGTLSDGPDARLSMPETVFEAYRVLGVRASGSERAVKKVVDALRMSWHPDLSVNEQDRVEREERIKQINLAWDIIKSDLEDAGTKTMATTNSNHEPQTAA